MTAGHQTNFGLLQALDNLCRATLPYLRFVGVYDYLLYVDMLPLRLAIVLECIPQFSLLPPHKVLLALKILELFFEFFQVIWCPHFFLILRLLRILIHRESSLVIGF